MCGTTCSRFLSLSVPLLPPVSEWGVAAGVEASWRIAGGVLAVAAPGICRPCQLRLPWPGPCMTGTPERLPQLSQA